MSYVVHLWEEAAPASLQDADRLHERLAATPATANPKFAELAQALIERFPAEVGGRGDASESWVESRPDGRTDTRVYSLGLYGEGITRLLPVLVKQATALGLTVYDDQAGRVYLPDGTVLGSDGPGQPPAAGVEAAAPVTVAQLKSRFKAVVLPALEAHGFKLQPEKLGLSFVRNRAVGEQKLLVELEHAGLHTLVRLYCTIVPTLPTAIRQTVGPGIRISLQARHCRPMERFKAAGDPVNGPFLVGGQEVAEQFITAYLAHLQAVWVPFLDAVSDVPGLLSCERDGERHQVACKPSYGTLGLAHWAGLADFDVRVAAFALHHRSDPGIERVLQSVVARLKARPDLFGTYPRMDLA